MHLPSVNHSGDRSCEHSLATTPRVLTTMDSKHLLRRMRHFTGRVTQRIAVSGFISMPLYMARSKARITEEISMERRFPTPVVARKSGTELINAVLSYGLCLPGPLLREFGLEENPTYFEVESRPNNPHQDMWTHTVRRS